MPVLLSSPGAVQVSRTDPREGLLAARSAIGAGAVLSLAVKVVMGGVTTLLPQFICSSTARTAK